MRRGTQEHDGGVGLARALHSGGAKCRSDPRHGGTKAAETHVAELSRRSSRVADDRE